MQFFSAFIYCLFFVLLAWKNFRLAVGLFIIALPTYLIRFSIGPLPTTALEITFGAIFLVWLIKYAKNDWSIIKETVNDHRLLFIFVGLFFLASVVSIFVSDMVIKSFGEWRAYFLEPIILFVILLGRREQIKSKDLIWFLAISTLSISILAIIQKFTGLLYPPSLWDDELNGRIVAFFTSPNAVGLYLAPVILLMITILGDRFYKYWTLLMITILLSLIAIFFTKSDGAWIALAIGALVFFFLIGYRKIAIATVLAGMILALIIPTIHQAVLFQDQAGKNRLILWSYSINYLTSSPKNFVFGTGIRQFFRKVQKPYYNVKEMERLIYPHNIFLNFWTETGLVGMLSFVGIMAYLFYLANKTRLQNKFIGVGLLAMLTVFVIHGLVDAPYFKNDLAMMFWVIVALVVNSGLCVKERTECSHVTPAENTL